MHVVKVASLQGLASTYGLSCDQPVPYTQPPVPPVSDKPITSGNCAVPEKVMVVRCETCSSYQSVSFRPFSAHAVPRMVMPHEMGSKEGEPSGQRSGQRSGAMLEQYESHATSQQ